MTKMNKNKTKVQIKNVERFWEANPVASKAINAPQESAKYFQKFDEIREADDCEPYEYSNLIHGYETSKNKKILDVGCGNGYVLANYAKNGAEVFGVDITKKAIELSKRRFNLYSLKGVFKKTNGESLAFDDESFDIVCSMGVLHHIENPKPMIDEMYRVLNPGGKIILMLYYRYSWKALIIIRLKRLLHPKYWGKSQQEALNMNDGDDCPLALVYSKGEAKLLLKNFDNHKMRLNQLSWKQFFIIPFIAKALGPFLPNQSNNLISRNLGWNLYIEASKPNTQ